MSTKRSAVPVIPWNWVIEALANFEQVDISTLVGLVKKVTAISDDLGNDAREMVSLRILESLFIHENEAAVDTDSAQNAKICFDPSERCEDVLQKVLLETSEPMSESERKKWDVRPFIMHKRSSLPTPCLKKLKEAILEGSHPLLVSLKERSKLGLVNVSETFSPVVDGTSDAQTTAAKDDLVSLNLGHGNNGGTAEHAGREECEMSIEPPVEALDENTLMGHEHTASKELGQSCDNGNTKHDQWQLAGGDDNFPRDTCREGQDKRVSIDSMKNLEFVGRFKDPKNNIQPKASNDGPSNEVENSLEQDGQLETGIDSDRSDDERIDIAAEKEAFLSSQCALSEDTMAMTDWSEMNLCMKCNEGGHLLVCSSDACPLRVHESCLGFAATLDENGEFFCPFCAYSHAIPKYLEAKRKASLARKDLQAFLGAGVERRRKMSSTKRCGSRKNELQRMGALASNSNGGTVSRGNIGPSCGEKGAAVSNAENPVLVEPSRLCVANELPCGDKVVSVGNQSLSEAEEVSQKVGEDCQSPTKMKEQQPSSKAVSGSGPKGRSYKGNGCSLGTGEHADIHLSNGCLNQPTTESPQKPLPRLSMPKRKCKGQESPLSFVSSYSKRLRKNGKPQYTSPAEPSLRRKILPWTKSEEEILKEGVQRFSGSNNKGIPWREILDFGGDVFHNKGRTTIDLKDKWRNICKGSPGSKS